MMLCEKHRLILVMSNVKETQDFTTVTLLTTAVHHSYEPYVGPGPKAKTDSNQRCKAKVQNQTMTESQDNNIKHPGP